jgi:hypothetical protein
MPRELDDSTFNHLTEWCDRNLHSPEAGRAKMIELLDTADEEDFERWLDHGWSHVATLCDAWNAEDENDRCPDDDYSSPNR